MDHFVHLIICRLKNKQKKERKKTLKLVLITEVILESFILGNVTKFKEHILIQFHQFRKVLLPPNLASKYSKNPHTRTCGLRTPRLKFGKKKEHIYKNTFSLKIENCSYI